VSLVLNDDLQSKCPTSQQTNVNLAQVDLKRLVVAGFVHVLDVLHSKCLQFKHLFAYNVTLAAIALFYI